MRKLIIKTDLGYYSGRAEEKYDKESCVQSVEKFVFTKEKEDALKISFSGSRSIAGEISDLIKYRDLEINYFTFEVVNDN